MGRQAAGNTTRNGVAFQVRSASPRLHDGAHVAFGMTGVEAGN